VCPLSMRKQGQMLNTVQYRLLWSSSYFPNASVVADLGEHIFSETATSLWQEYCCSTRSRILPETRWAEIVCRCWFWKPTICCITALIFQVSSNLWTSHISFVLEHLVCSNQAILCLKTGQSIGFFHLAPCNRAAYIFPIIQSSGHSPAGGSAIDEFCSTFGRTDDLGGLSPRAPRTLFCPSIFLYREDPYAQRHSRPYPETCLRCRLRQPQLPQKQGILCQKWVPTTEATAWQLNANKAVEGVSRWSAISLITSRGGSSSAALAVLVEECSLVSGPETASAIVYKTNRT
jgi:hypothetical protein